MKGENVDVFGFFESGAGRRRRRARRARRGAPGPARLLLREGAGARRRAAFLEAFLPQFYDANPFLPVGDPPARGDRGPEAPRGLPRGAPRRAGDGPGAPARRRGRARRDWPRRNARERHRVRFRRTGGDEALAVERLSRAIGLAIPPQRIEAFDISHPQGTDSVASLVVFEDGKPKKSDYRLFNIASQDLLAPDDFRSMAEVVERRYRRVQAEGGAMAGPHPGGRRPRPAAGRADRARPARPRAAGRRSRQARGGDLGARPPRARSGCRARTRRCSRPAGARRGAPLRDHAAPGAAGQADAPDRADRDPGRRPDARAAAAAPVRLGRRVCAARTRGRSRRPSGPRPRGRSPRISAERGRRA